MQDNQVRIGALDGKVSTRHFKDHPPCTGLFVRGQSPRDGINSVLPSKAARNLPATVQVGARAGADEVIPFEVHVLFFLSSVCLCLCMYWGGGVCYACPL